MKNKLLLLASAITALLLPSCFQHETTITLNKDGSGTLVEESRLGAQMLAMMSQMAEGLGGGGENAQDPLKEMFSEDKAKKRATELGEGVTFEKSEPVAVNGSKGAKVTYRFKDINTLKVRSGDGMKNMSPGPGAPGLDEAAKKEDPVTFAYQDGKLTVKLPQPKKDGEKPADESAEKPDMENPEAMEMMKQMFADMKMGIKLVIAPGIAETTATHKEGDTITLMEMDFGKLVQNPEHLKKMAAMDQQDPTAAMEALKGIDGVKFEAKPEITVTLK